MAPCVVEEEDPGDVASVGAELVAGELALVGGLDHHKVGGQLLDLLGRRELWPEAESSKLLTGCKVIGVIPGHKKIRYIVSWMTVLLVKICCS